MLFEGLNGLKRNAIMTSICLMSFAIVILMLPAEYLPAFIGAIGSIMIIISIIMIFDFLTSKRALIHYVFLCAALALAIGGLAILTYQSQVLFVLGWLFGIVLIIEGIHGIFHSWVYARRSGRQGWWTLIPLYALLIALGVVLLANPWWNEPGAFKMIIGWCILFSALVSMLRLIWVWPIKTK